MIEINRLRFSYGPGAFTLDVPELRIARGEKVAFAGPSGTGKTTLIHLIAGLLVPDAGSVRVDDFDLTRQSEDRLRAFRISRIGLVFQEFELIDYLSVRENILLPFYLNAALTLSPTVRRGAVDLASSMNLADKLQRRPGALSHGERQRVAICRALITGPELLIADEPTGNLDADTARSIVSILLREVGQRSATLVMVTHNRSLLGAFDRVIDVASFAPGDGS
jgi:putative ABC transport system ATP-binding protein